MNERMSEKDMHGTTVKLVPARRQRVRAAKGAAALEKLDDMVVSPPTRNSLLLDDESSS
jgi:hypothetical protein